MNCASHRDTRHTYSPPFPPPDSSSASAAAGTALWCRGLGDADHVPSPWCRGADTSVTDAPSTVGGTDSVPDTVDSGGEQLAAAEPALLSGPSIRS